MKKTLTNNTSSYTVPLLGTGFFHIIHPPVNIIYEVGIWLLGGAPSSAPRRQMGPFCSVVPGGTWSRCLSRSLWEA